MAERVEMSFKNKEMKMWFLIMGPALIIGSILMFSSISSNRYLPFSILLVGYAIYYPWRYLYRKKKKEAGVTR